MTLRASSLFGLAFATEEILTDSPISFAVLIENGFREQFAFHMLNEKLRGNGGNEYLGVLNSPANPKAFNRPATTSRRVAISPFSFP